MRNAYTFFQDPSSLFGTIIKHWKLINRIFSTCRERKYNFNTMFYNIFAWSAENFRNQFGKLPISNSGYSSELIQDMPSILGIMPVRLHVSYSFSWFTKDDYCNWIQTKTNYECEKSRNINTVKLLLITLLENWVIAPITAIFSRSWLLKIFLKGSCEWRTTSRRTCNTKVFLCHNKTHWESSPFTLTWIRHRSTATRETKLIVFFYFNGTSPTSTTSEIQTVARCAASPNVDGATLSAPKLRSCLSLTVFLRSKNFSQQDFRSSITGSASNPVVIQGSKSEMCRTAAPAATAVFSMLIPVSEKKLL